MICASCRRELTYDECGLNKKFNASGQTFCLPCLAERLGVTEDRLQEKTEEFRNAGCLLFSRKETVE